ncbi:MAG: hypothetical protein M3R41_02875 [Pseudomonadota bacterium]|nr:hypothetical protein [Pseudomonadota bacterium]
MKLDIAGVLRAAWRLWRTDHAILLPVMGIFFFLPVFAQGLFLPLPDAPSDGGQILTNAVEVMQRWYLANAVPLLASQAWTLAGSAIVFSLYLRAEAGTLHEAVATGLRAWPRYIMLALLVDMLLGAGLVLFILPGYYLVGRLILTGPILFAERPASVVESIARSVRRTRGRGFLLAGLGMFAPIIAYLVAVPVQAVGGALDHAPLANPVSGAIIDAAIGAIAAAATLGGLLIRIALYRQMQASR